MICEECKECVNYKVCENGCHGSIEPCEYFDNGFMKSIRALNNVVTTINTLTKEYDEVFKSKELEDPSRRRFEKIACRGRNRKPKRK